MELCREPDIFIGRRTNKFRRYSGLLEQPVPSEEQKNLRRSTRRRITIGSYDESSHHNYNNNVPMSEKYCKNNLPGDEEGICNPVPTKQTFTRSKTRSRRKSFNLNCAFIEDEENNENMLASEITSPKRVLTKKPCKRCNGRKPKKSFDLNCTFIEDESQAPETQLNHQTLPYGRRYSLRSSLNTLNHDPKKNEDIGGHSALHPINDLSLIESENGINDKDDGHQGAPTEEAKTIQFSEVDLDQDLPYNNRSYSLQSSLDTFNLHLKRNEDFVTLRNNNKCEDEDDIKEPLETVDLRINEIPEKLRSNREYDYTNHSVIQTEYINSRMRSADVNCKLIEEKNLISEFQSGRHYSLRSSLGAFEPNLNEFEHIDSNCTQPIESVDRSDEKTEEILLILEIDESTESEKLKERIALPSTQGEESKENPDRMNHRISEGKTMNRRKYCGAKCRYLKNIDKIATESYSDNKSFRSTNTSDNIIKRNESFVTDRKTNDYISIPNNIDEDNREILKSTNNRTEAYQKNIGPNDCNMLLDAEISSSPRKNYFSGDNFGQSSRKNNSEMVFRKANFNQNGLLEKWIRSYFHLNPNKQSSRKWESLSTLEQKPTQWNGAPNQFTQQDGKYLFKSNIGNNGNMEEISSKSNTPSSGKESREEGKKQYNQEKERKPCRKNVHQEGPSDLETIQTNTPSSEKTSAGGRKQGNQGKPKLSRKKKLQKRSSNLETIFEIPQEEFMSSRKFKRTIDFENFNSLARIRRRKIRAKKVNPLVYRDIVDFSRLDAILDKLSLSD